MALKTKELMETPIASINITNTNQVDVTEYAKAQVVDNNLKAENIKKDVVVLGITGTDESFKPEQSKTATPTTSQQTITPDSGYALSSVVVNAMPSGSQGDISEVSRTVSASGSFDRKATVVLNQADTTGYISGTTKSLSIDVSTSELCSGKYTATDTASHNIRKYATMQIVDSNLVARNIKKDTSILGVTGTYQEIDRVSSVPSTKSTDIIYNTSDSSYYLWEPDYLCFTANTAGSTVSMSLTGIPTRTVSFEYSTDRNTWNTFTVGSTTITLTNIGDKVYFRGNNPNGISESGSIYYKFVMTGSIAASGNIMSLIDNTCESLIIPCIYCFACMFNGCTSLTTAPALPATTSVGSCYYRMFASCTSLTTAPALPATTLAIGCYYGMFYGCTALITAPELPATFVEENSYAAMFENCTSLTTAPALPIISSFEESCSNMFKGCTSLTSVPALINNYPYNCYNGMFSGCTSLYVSDTSVSETCEKAWRMPTSGTFTNTNSQTGMFHNCLGTRASDNMAGAQGQSYTYYTQNTPV